jgi:predicted dehydrogenase
MGIDKIKIAVIGSGMIGPRHADSVVAFADATLLCFVDPASTAQAVAARYNVPLYPSISKMLRAGEVPDAAIVCTPNSTHVAVSQELLRAGIHVLVEKPLSTTIASGQDLIQTAEESGKKLLVGHHRRFNPYTLAAKRLLVEGVIGRPIAVSGLWTTYKPKPYFEGPGEWRTNSAGGGPILINLIHDVDLLQYLFGPIVRVHAEQTISQRGYEAEEGAAILLRLASGMVGTFILCDSTPSTHNFESATGENPMIPQAGKDVYRIFGTDGTFSFGDMKVTKYCAGSEKSWAVMPEEMQVPVGNEVPFSQQVEHLVRVVRDEEAPICSGLDGLRAVVVCDAVKKALSTGNAVDIET